MTKNKVLRKVLLVFSWLALFEMTIRFILGKADIFTIICLVICYSIWFLNLVLDIILKIQTYKMYKAYEDGFKYLKAVHKARYKLYFTGNKEDIETYSAEIERYGKAMLDVGEYYISNKKLNKRQKKTIQEILNETKRLMTTTN